MFFSVCMTQAEEEIWPGPAVNPGGAVSLGVEANHVEEAPAPLEMRLQL